MYNWNYNKKIDNNLNYEFLKMNKKIRRKRRKKEDEKYNLRLNKWNFFFSNSRINTLWHIDNLVIDKLSCVFITFFQTVLHFNNKWRVYMNGWRVIKSNRNQTKKQTKTNEHTQQDGRTNMYFWNNK